MSYLFFLFLAFAQEQQTESQKICLEQADSKKAILEKVMGTCKWKLPVTENAGAKGEGVVGYCSAYDTFGDKKYKKISTYTGSGHNGVLECGSSFGEKDDSYKSKQPVFVYQCSSCSTGDKSGNLDKSCIQSMNEIEKDACKHNTTPECIEVMKKAEQKGCKVGTKDPECIALMGDQCKAAGPKMNFRYAPGQEPTPVNGKGTPVR